MNILIVDDKKESLYLLETMLKGNGYHTFSASNGKEALQILDKQEIDLIISDILMPEMDGFQLCKAVKTSDKFRQIPFVFYTATFTTRQDEILALKLGASRFLRKPMEPEKFLEQIQGLMENLKEGDLQSQEPKYKDEEEVLRLYDERLVTKLEKKMKDLGEERALFTEVFDRVPLLMTMYDPDIKILRLNDAFTKTTGWTEDDTRRTDIMATCYPDPKYREIVRDFMIPAQKGWREFRVRCKDGRDIDVLWSNISMPDGVQVGIGIDITRRKKDEIQMQKHLEENQFLAETSIALSKTKNIDEVCRLVGQKTHDLDSSSYVILSTYNEECEGIRIHCIVGLNDKMSQVSELLGQKPSDLVFEPDKIRPERIQDYHSGKLIQIKDGLYELLGRRIDKSRCRKVEKYLNVNEVWHIGFTVDDMPYGTLTIMVKTGAEIHFPKAIETLMGTAAAVIKRFIAEKALKQSEKRFRSLYENATIGFYRTTPDGQILMANPALVQMLGFDSLADLQKRNLQENGYEPDYPRAEFLKTIYETGEIVGLESAWKRKTGKWIYVRENAHAVHDEKGAVQFFEGTVENISYERKAEEELQLRAQLLDMASDSIFLHDTEGNFIYFNENAYKTLGYTQEEFAGLKLREIDAPKYIQKIPNRMQRLLEIGHLSFETEHRHKNGAFIPMEVSARIIEIDKKPHVLAAVRNISERKKAEAALRDSETHFRMIAENIQDGITYIEEGAVKYRNDRVCDILGFTQSELKKLRIHELAAPEDADRVNAEFSAKLKSNLKAFNIDFWVIRKDGERRYIDNRYSIPDPAHPQTYYVTSTDQTEWKNAEEERIRLQDQLLQSQKMESIGTLAGGVAHDFNNLLTVIQGHAQLTMMSMTDSDPNYRGLRQIVNASTRAANLTRQLLLFSRKEAMDFKPINLNWTLENLIAMLQRLIGEDIRIDTFLSNDLWQINADEGNLEQVIMNITVNARDAMPRGGKVSIKTENLFLSEAECKIIDESYSGRFVRLSIEDTGTGIPADILDKIFEPFYSTKEVGKGTGLGLSVVYGIIKKHDGWINVYSESGQGTIFKIYLPAITVKVLKTEKKKSGFEDLTGRGERILVIEDEEEVRNFAVAALRQNGYLTIEAENSAAALEVFKKEKGRFDLILSDVILPDKNGFLLVEELLEIRGDIPVIMCSGYTEEKVQQTIIQKQGFRFLQKPYNLQEMLLTVKQVLNPS